MGPRARPSLLLSKVVYSTAEPISCRHAWQRMAVPERSSFLGWAPNIPASHRGSSMALVQMDLGKSFLLTRPAKVSSFVCSFFPGKVDLL